MSKPDDNIDLINENEEKTMPLTSSSFTNEPVGPLSGGEAKRRIPTGTILLVVVVLLAGAGLFSMRKLATASASGNVNGEIEKRIKDLLDGLDRTGSDPDAGPELVSPEEALRPLSVDYDTERVPPENVQKDPFEIYVTNTDHPGPTIPAVVPIEIQREQFRQQATLASSAFKVKSVMAGSTPLANLNGEIVRVGAIVTDEQGLFKFKVWNINSDGVTLMIQNKDLDVDLEIPISVHPEF